MNGKQMRENPILEANAEAFNNAATNDREAFDLGWEAALRFDRPLIQAAFQCWEALSEEEMLDDTGLMCLKAAEKWLSIVNDK